MRSPVSASSDCPAVAPARPTTPAPRATPTAASRHPNRQPREKGGVAMTVSAAEAQPAPAKRGFKLPSAYTILFLLIVLTAIATWLIPAGSYDYQDGSPVPGTYHAVDAQPARILVDSLMAPVNGMYGIEAADRS